MKGLVKAFAIGSLFVFTTFCFANTSSHTNSWTCKTNASSAASGSAEEKADNQMEKKAMAGKSAFDFAMKHCRDCNEITCKMQTK